MYQDESWDWSAVAVHEVQRLPDDLSEVKRADSQKHETQEDWGPAVQLSWACCRTEQSTAHCGNESEPAVGINDAAWADERENSSHAYGERKISMMEDGMN